LAKKRVAPIDQVDHFLAGDLFGHFIPPCRTFANRRSQPNPTLLLVSFFGNKCYDADMRYKGVVLKGRSYGHVLGFPTVNIEMNDEQISGIYAAMVYVDGKEFPAAAYADLSRNTLEAHLLDFGGDLYGKEIEIELLHKIREDEQFPVEASLKAAIAADVAKAREYFKK
jgi:FAD synthase